MTAPGKDRMELSDRQSQPGNEDGQFSCSVCSKTYTRRELSSLLSKQTLTSQGDLRDRHRRRCIKTAGQERRSKRKSCEACARRKLRCCMTRPVCRRCAQVPPRIPRHQEPKNMQNLSVPTSYTSVASSSAPAVDDMPATLTEATNDPNAQHISASAQQSSTEEFDPLLSTPLDPFSAISIDLMSRAFSDDSLFSLQDRGSVPWELDFTPMSDFPDSTDIAQGDSPNPRLSPNMPLHESSNWLGPLGTSRSY